MKRINWKKLKLNALSTIITFPVEIILSISLFVFAVLQEEKYWNAADTEPYLAYIPLFWLLSFSLNQVFTTGKKRLIYYFSVILPFVIPLITIKPFSITYFMIWLIALTVLLACRRQKDNFYFTIDSLRVPFHIAISGFLTLALIFLVWGIYASLIYIFDLEAYSRNSVVFYIFVFPITIIAPFLFCLFQRLDQNKFGWKPDKFFKILNNWILSPALIIYTAILYIYGLKILIIWSLPKGMLSYMISAFLFIAVISRALQELLDKKHYNRYYSKLNLIAIPILVLFWIGIIYRVNEYGFTEDRVFLFTIAALLSVITLAPVVSNKARYLHFMYLVIIVLIPITLVPPISANKLGVISQEKRLKNVIKELDLQDPETGLIRKTNIPGNLYSDSSEQLYSKLTETFTYIYNQTSPEYMEKKFGYSSIENLNQGLFADNLPDYINNKMPYDYLYYRKSEQYSFPVNEYNELVVLPVTPVLRNDSVVLLSDSLVITAFDLSDFFLERPALLDNITDRDEINNLLYLKNDSCFASINYISIRNKKIEYMSLHFLLTK